MFISLKLLYFSFICKSYNNSSYKKLILWHLLKFMLISSQRKNDAQKQIFQKQRHFHGRDANFRAFGLCVSFCGLAADFGGAVRRAAEPAFYLHHLWSIQFRAF